MKKNWATPRITAEDTTKLEGLVETMTKAVEAGDTRAYVRANHDFHFTIYAASGSETLLDVIEGLWLQVSPYFHLLHGVRGAGVAGAARDQGGRSQQGGNGERHEARTSQS